MEEKTCNTCGVTKEITSFYTFYDKRRGRDYTFAKCRSCHLIATNLWSKQNSQKVKDIQSRSQKKNRRKYYLAQVERWRKDWKTRTAQRRQWDANHKKTRKELAEILFIDQDKRCAICTSPFADKEKYDIDHSHTTGLVRGLLCRKCNSGLHYLEDASFIKAAQSYLNNAPASLYPPVKY